MQLSAGERDVWGAAYVAELRDQEKKRPKNFDALPVKTRETRAFQERFAAASYATATVEGLRALLTAIPAWDKDARETIADVMCADPATGEQYR